uniref:Uncharacterized protein n=1 Tax=Ditylenchus dipsaci TaxID=166011 RepID=A0A915D6E9_9BILA
MLCCCYLWGNAGATRYLMLFVAFPPFFFPQFKCVFFTTTSCVEDGSTAFFCPEGNKVSDECRRLWWCRGYGGGFGGGSYGGYNGYGGALVDNIVAKNPYSITTLAVTTTLLNAVLTWKLGSLLC